MNCKTVLILFLIIPWSVAAQNKADSLIMNERTMDRLFTLYKNQIRVNGGYVFSTFKSEFDESGDKNLLSDQGVSSNMHQFDLSIRYGILNFLDAQVHIEQKTKNDRLEPLYVISLEPPIQILTDVTAQGLEDIRINLNARVPFRTRKYDLGGAVGMYLPTAENQPDQPNNEVGADEIGEVINIRHSEKWGYGSSSIYFLISAKVRLSRMAFSFVHDRRLPMSESESIQWDFWLKTNGKFDYDPRSYDLLKQRISNFKISGEYQFYPWFNAFVNVSTSIKNKGWTEISGQRLALSDQKNSNISVGYELLITSKLWLRQWAIYGVSGENSLNPFTIHTLFSYNLFTK